MKSNTPENSGIDPTGPNDSTCEEVRRRGFGSWLASAEGRQAIVCIALVFFSLRPDRSSE